MQKCPYDYICFTDGSCRITKDGYYSAYGVVIVNTNSMTYTTAGGDLGERTSIFAEIYAIYKATAHLVDMGKDREIKALIVTDSKFCVQSLTYYIYKDWDTTSSIWLKKDRKPVNNQEVFKRIKYLTDTNPNVKIEIVHINSHVKNDKQAISKVISKFQDYQLYLDYTTVQTMIAMNNLADRIATGITARRIKEDLEHGKLPRLQWKKPVM